MKSLIFWLSNRNNDPSLITGKSGRRRAQWSRTHDGDTRSCLATSATVSRSSMNCKYEFPSR